MHEESKERFLKDVADHEMRIVRDDGVNRFVRFRKAENITCWFDLITWPGCLCINGDMGTYVFSRTEDMFEFFRTGILKDGSLRINPHYWEEKILAESRFAGVKKYEPERFREDVKEWLRDYMDGEPELMPDIWAAVERDVFCRLDEKSEEEAIRDAMDFRHEGHAPFQDFWEADCKEYTFQYLWCCQAIVWGIKQYDIQKSTTQIPRRNGPCGHGGLSGRKNLTFRLLQAG